MSAFNDVNGIPASGNRRLLTDILRGEWGFEGFVVSDYTSEQELIAHGFAEDGRDAARIARTGTREEKSGKFLPPPGWTGHLVTADDAAPPRRRKKA